MPNNFTKACPHGNTMVDGYKETKVREEEYYWLEEEREREE